MDILNMFGKKLPVNYVIGCCQVIHYSLIYFIAIDIFIKKKEKVELIDIEKPSINSIILETIPRESQDGKAFYVIPAMPESLVKLVK